MTFNEALFYQVFKCLYFECISLTGDLNNRIFDVKLGFKLNALNDRNIL